MILSFGDAATDDLYNGINSRASRTVPIQVWSAAARKLDMLNAARSLGDLLAPSGNRLERLKGNLADFYSIRINDQYRLIFKWLNGNAEMVRVADYHK